MVQAVGHYQNYHEIPYKPNTELLFCIVSGKSHTMIGSDADFGMIPRTVDYLLECIPNYYNFKAEFFEIYNENIIDLLNENNNTIGKPIIIYQATLKTGAKVEKVANLQSIEIESAAQFNGILKKVIDRRKNSATARNLTSSRSHAVIQIGIEGKFANANGQKIESSLIFFDLAGCENANDHLNNADRGKTQNEMVNINKSVTNFQAIIESLKRKETAPDFRSSKLTHLLKPCLTTNTKTLMITTISQETKYLSTSKETSLKHKKHLQSYINIIFFLILFILQQTISQQTIY